MNIEQRLTVRGVNTVPYRDGTVLEKQEVGRYGTDQKSHLRYAVSIGNPAEYR